MKRVLPILLVVAALAGWAGYILLMEHPSRPDLQSLTTGQMAGFEVFDEPRAVPGTPFYDREGNSHSLQDFAGMATLVNVWATWCEPCREEMPALAALERRMAGQPFRVVTLSVDWQGFEVIDPFLAEVGAEGLPAFWDKSGRLPVELEAKGLPLTILIGPDGEWIGRMDGPADWSGPDARRLMEAAKFR